MNSFPNPEIWGKTYTPEGEAEQRYYPLLAHMLDTVAAFKAVYEQWLTPRLQDYLNQQFNTQEEALTQIALACGLHDIGKCTPIFQAAMLSPNQGTHSSQQLKLENTGLMFPSLSNYDTATLRDRKIQRHEKLGHWLLADRTDMTNHTISESWLPASILGHHGSYDIKYKIGRGKTDLTTLNNLISQEWIDEAAKHVTQIEKVTNTTLTQLCPKISNEAVILISGLIVLSDRLASNERTVQNSHTHALHHLLKEDPEEYLAEQQKFLNKLIPEVLGTATELTEQDILHSHPPRGVQTLIPSSRGLWMVMAATGSGKTEAALLRHKAETENLLFLLPTKSTTDAMFSRITRTYKNQDRTVATIAHSDSRLNTFYNRRLGFNDTEDHSCSTGLIPSKLTNAGAKLSAPVTIATIDQFVMGGLPLKWSPLRLLTIANTHTVIDEAHLLDPYQITLVSELLHFLGKLDTRVTVLSATMPTELKKQIVENYTDAPNTQPKTTFPSAELHTKNGHSQKHNLTQVAYSVNITTTDSENSVEAHIDWAEQKLTQSPQARLGIFVNTVQRSQNIAEYLQQKHPDVKIICLNSRMLGTHKNLITQKLIKDLGSQTGTAERTILVGTQLIEMSLDIDLDYISTDLCPAPSIIQRLGRAWRNRTPEHMQTRSKRIGATPTNLELHIVTFPEEENSKTHLPYMKSQLTRTQNYINELKTQTLHFPKDVQEFVDSSYLPETTLITADDESEHTDRIFSQLRAAQIKSPIKEFLNPETTHTEAHMLTSSQLGEETATRLIEAKHPNLILLSQNPELIKLGALHASRNPHTLTLTELKSASIPTNYKIIQQLQEANITAMKIGTTTYAYIGELPPGITYNTLTGIGIGIQ